MIRPPTSVAIGILLLSACSGTEDPGGSPDICKPPYKAYCGPRTEASCDPEVPGVCGCGDEEKFEGAPWTGHSECDLTTGKYGECICPDSALGGAGGAPPGVLTLDE